MRRACRSRSARLESALCGRSVVITGAARGIGYATAHALLASGAIVTIGDRDVAALHSALDRLRAVGGTVSGHPVDVGDPASFAAFVDACHRDGSGRIDVLINNAGVMPIGPFLDQSDRAVQSTIDVNLRGVLNGCRLVLPEMAARRSGHIVNVASLAATVPVPGQAVYAGTKAAVVALSTALSDEFAPQGVDISAVLPPFTKTGLIDGMTVPAGSVAVEPDVIAAAILRTIIAPTTIVVVPRVMRFVAPAMSMLGPRARRWINARVGSDDAFLAYDVEARRHYQHRAESALGLVEEVGHESV
jgi:short-subunit dehydrogenase